MVALQLGVLEQFKRWNREDQQQLEDAIPEIVAGLERVRGQTEALANWMRRLGAIVEQDLAAPSRCSASVASLPKTPQPR